MYYTVSTLWGSRTNKSLGTYNIVLLALNYQMYNIAKHTYITSFWAVHHSTSMRNHAHIKWNTLLETTITSLIHFSGIPREFSKTIDVTLCSGDTQLSQNTHGKAKRAWFAAEEYQKSTAVTHLPYPNSAKWPWYHYRSVTFHCWISRPAQTICAKATSLGIPM